MRAGVSPEGVGSEQRRMMKDADALVGSSLFELTGVPITPGQDSNMVGQVVVKMETWLGRKEVS